MRERTGNLGVCEKLGEKIRVFAETRKMLRMEKKKRVGKVEFLGDSLQSYRETLSP